MSDNDRVPVPERPERKKFNAPLWAGGVVVLGLIAVLLVNVLGHRDQLTVDNLNKPAVAAVDGGSEVYPANSELAFTENVKFGYLPAPTLSALSDGAIVAADPESAPKLLGIKDGLDSLDEASFLDKTIKAPREGTANGSPITWEQMVESLSKSTVLMPMIESTEISGPALTAVAEAGVEKSVIVRTSNPDVAKAAQGADIATLFSGDPAGVKADVLKSQGFTMVSVAAKDVDNWLDSDLEVWVNDVATKEQLSELGKKGIFGALSTNPYEIQPSAVKTD